MNRRERRRARHAEKAAQGTVLDHGPSSVANVIPWLGNGQTTGTGIAIDADAALSVTTAFACVRLIAGTAAAITHQLYQEDDAGNIKQIRNHPVSRLLERPNNFQTPFEYRQFKFTSLCLRGNAFSYIDRDAKGYPVGLFPLHPDQVQIFSSMDGRSIWYRVTLWPSGETIDCSQDDIKHDRIFGLSPYIGLSPIRCAREAFGLAIAEERHGARFFKNSVATSGTVEVPGKLKPEQRREIGDELQKMHTAENAHKIFILEGGWKYTPIGMSNADAQYLGSRKFQAEEICRIWLVPPHMVGVMDRAGITSIEMLNRTFYDAALAPYLVGYEQRADESLLSDADRAKGLYTRHDATAFLNADTVNRFRAYATGRQWGWYSVNDIRRKEDMSPIEGGDIYLQPSNMQPAGDATLAATGEKN